MGLNKAMLIGRVTLAPELGKTSRGGVKCTFTVTTSEAVARANGSTFAAELEHDIIAFGQLANLCKQHLRRGSRVYLEGRNSPSRFTDQVTGRSSMSHSIVVQAVQVLGATYDRGISVMPAGENAFSLPTETTEAKEEEHYTP